MSCKIILIRHAEVEVQWKMICYGALDVPLSAQGVIASQLTEMQRRIVHWYDEITSQSHGRIIAISHSGPIAALAGHLLGLPANQWQPWTIKNLLRGESREPRSCERNGSQR